MDKRTIVKILEKKEMEAIMAVRKRRDEALTENVDRVFKKCNTEDSIRKIESLITEVASLYDGLKERFPKEAPLADYRGGSLGCYLSYLTEMPIEKRLKEYDFSDKSKDRTSIEKKYNEMEGGVINSYAQVIESVKSAKTSKAAIEFLMEVGFDKKDFEDKKTEETTALAININKNYLFIA